MEQLVLQALHLVLLVLLQLRAPLQVLLWLLQPAPELLLAAPVGVAALPPGQTCWLVAWKTSLECSLHP